MPKPICVKCKKEMLIKKLGIAVKDKAFGAFPATMWYGDLYECSSCGIQMITGFGQAMEAARYPEDILQFEYS